ncbi:MAG: aspartoacylase [Desulfobacterales bacterium]|nr:aspartoacylase [Desulfobacterales bacterium]
MRTDQLDQHAEAEFKTVFIVGGTHGNERTGVMLVRRWQRDPTPVRREMFTTRLLMANPEAIRRNTRFVHQDLNRSFGSPRPGAAAAEPYEIHRAREIRAVMAGARARVFTIDLHTTTSNMGITLITDTAPVNLMLAAQVKQRDPAMHIYAFPPGERIDNCLRASADAGLGLEIGPIPQGLVRHDVLQAAEDSVQIILDVIDAHGRGRLRPPDPRTRIYLHDAHVHYPESRDSADAACVHRDLDGRDYRPLEAGMPVFHCPNGETVHFEGAPGRIPVFINEAAYYPEQIAFSLTRPVTLEQLLPPHRSTS